MSTPLDFLPFVLPYVHDCGEPVAMRAIVDTIVDFCETTDWLQIELDPISIYAGQAEYEMEGPLDTLVVRIIEANIEGNLKPLKPYSAEELVRLYGDWRGVEGDPVGYTQSTPDRLRLVPSPTTNVGEGLRLVVSLRPTLNPQEIDDGLFQRYAEAIGCGAQYRLKMMQNQPFYDPAGAVQPGKTYAAARDRATIERQKGFTTAPQVVQMRRFL